MSEVYEIPNGAAQRDLIVGEWLLIPDLTNVGHHTVVAGETLEVLAERWYGESGLWPIISIANHLADGDPAPGTVLIQPRLNRIGFVRSSGRHFRCNHCIGSRLGRRCSTNIIWCRLRDWFPCWNLLSRPVFRN
jgi:hypothetical protein